MKPCVRFLLTGMLVGGRHRWYPKWGVGCCRWCGRTLEELKDDSNDGDRADAAYEQEGDR